MSLGKKLRFEIFKRDGFTCAYCGRTPPAVLLEVDHVKPLAGGGSSDMDNLVTSCADCNRGKGATALTSIPQSLKEKSEIIAEREAQLKAYTTILRKHKERIESETWSILKMLKLVKLEGEQLTANKREFSSVKRFVMDLGIVEVEQAAEIANDRIPYSNSSRFLYFCGICWKKVKQAKQNAAPPSL